MKLQSFIPSVLVLFLVAACERPGSESASFVPSEEQEEEVRTKGEEAATALMQSLGGQLKGALQSGGPVSAIQVCQQAAMPLTEAAGAGREGVTIRRTTLRPRNPANAPDEIDREVLTGMEAAMDKESSPPGAVIRWESATARYYRPLLVQEVCLNCHGDPESFPSALTDALAQLYPDDEATGYSLGQLRGVIRVDVSLE